MTIVDADQRQSALDPLRSFCVSAPAGSGKTELLIQRYLTLLARVNRPEQVLAITFTRKAAAEMRARVWQALVDAGLGEACDGEHQKQTRALALQALAADEREGWQLVRNISRLNIKTIDSFCSNLTRQMPVLSQFGGQAEVLDNAQPLYAEAVIELFKILDSQNLLTTDLTALMLHFDNDWARLQQLLTSMLARRDQWRAYIGVHHQAEEAESYLLHTVNGIVTEALVALSDKLGPYKAQLLDLQQYAADTLGKQVPDRFPLTTPSELALWRGVRTLLLTAGKNASWRARVDKRTGFPAGAGLARQRKEQILQLIAQLREVDGLLEALQSIDALPNMESDSGSWKLVLHLSRILPRLAAELLLVFQRHGKVDHSQVSLSALQAMGDDEMPTELALRLDYQLEHILVDEFQDTAINQYELVRRLTRGWGENNERNPQQPRTLMIVGDGMQSIYGFRDANVGLFLQARQQGFNGVRLESISLRSNFRSDEGIVAWVNSTFAQAFPADEDVSRGQIRFTEASAVRSAGLTPAVSLQGFIGADPVTLEVAAICEAVQLGIADDRCHSIAILARTRGHLQPILEQFKAREILYSAQDVDSLARSAVVVDLLSLCKALSNPADRVSWMALLRAPWCGLGLADLHIIGTWGEVPRYTPIGLVLTHSDIRERLSVDGQARVAHVANALGRAQLRRDRLALRPWIEQLWLELGGAAAAPSEDQLEDAERFFQLLEQADQEGEGLSLSWLQSKLEKLYVQAENPSSKVQVMTLHKAKGLEFDWVIIPSLQKITRTDARPLLLWDDHISLAGERGFLLAADDHSKPDAPTLYNWLKHQRTNKEILENTRLLYVGATRAVQRLFLTACLNYDESKDEYRDPPARSLLASIWRSFREQMTVGESAARPTKVIPGTTARPITRLNKESIERLSAATARQTMATQAGGANSPIRNLNRSDRYVGTVVHLALEQLAGQPVLPSVPADQHLLRWQRELARLGLHGETLLRASARVEASVATVLADPIGRWILSPEHLQAENEWNLTYVDEQGNPNDIIVDRTFVDRESKQRWLIDYKNSLPEDGETLEDFTRREAGAYRIQLALYRDVLEALWGQPVSCALYFTALGHLFPVEAWSCKILN